MSRSCSQVKTAAPTTGPESDSMPPSSTMSSASKERGIDISSGKIEPLEKAKRPPASPAMAPAKTKATSCWRTEEHTSELQSLMSNSYAVCCLKTTTKNKTYRTTYI